MRGMDWFQDGRRSPEIARAPAETARNADSPKTARAAPAAASPARTPEVTAP